MKGGAKDGKKRAGNNFKFMPPTNLQQLKKKQPSDLLLVLHIHNEWAATAGPAGHSEELDCYQCGGGTKKVKKNHFGRELK